jgi:hypothetical protein
VIFIFIFSILFPSTENDFFVVHSELLLIFSWQAHKPIYQNEAFLVPHTRFVLILSLLFKGRFDLLFFASLWGLL